MRDSLREIYRNRGVSGLWHGTSAGVMKTVPKYCVAVAVKVCVCERESEREMSQCAISGLRFAPREGGQHYARRGARTPLVVLLASSPYPVSIYVIVLKKKVGGASLCVHVLRYIRGACLPEKSRYT